jgi:hypothetical protein
MKVAFIIGRYDLFDVPLVTLECFGKQLIDKNFHIEVVTALAVFNFLVIFEKECQFVVIFEYLANRLKMVQSSRIPIVLKYYLNINTLLFTFLHQTHIIFFVSKRSLLDLQVKIAEKREHVIAREFLLDQAERHFL